MKSLKMRALNLELAVVERAGARKFIMNAEKFRAESLSSLIKKTFDADK